jgi:hypothetical protein
LPADFTTGRSTGTTKRIEDHMEAESRYSDDLAEPRGDVQLPTDEPPIDLPDAPRRHQVVSIFTRRAFLLKDTGRRGHQHPGGPDEQCDEQGAP